MVMKPRSGSLTIDTTLAAMSVLMRSAILRARPASAMRGLLGAQVVDEQLGDGQALRRSRGATTRSPPCPTRHTSGAGLLAHFVRGDEVAELEVVVGPQVDAALEALADLGDVILEPAQAGDLDVLGDDHTVAGDACPGAALDLAAAHDGTGDVAELAGAEDLADLGGAELHLLELRLEHALEGRLDLLDGLVDHRVVADLHTLTLGVVGVLALGADVEPDDHRAGRHRQVDVVHRDRTDAAVDDPQVDLVAHVDLEQRVLERFHGTGHVALEDEVEGLDLACSEGLGEVLERDALAGLGQRGL